MLWHILGVVVASYWISSAFGWKFWPVAIGLGVLWGGYHLARHFHWFGLAPAPARAAGGRGLSAGVTKFLVGFATLTGVMMIGTKVVGVSNNFAFTYLLGWGPRPWLYPQATTDILIWVSLLFLSAVIAVLAANGKAKPALVVFGITLVFLFVVRELPRTSEAARPKASTPMAVAPTPAPTTKWEEADQAASEGRGIAPVAVDTAKKAVIGDNVAKRTGTLIRETTVGFLEGLFPPKPATTSSSVVQVAYAAPGPGPTSVVAGQSKRLYRFGSNGCVTVTLRGDWSDYPKGGRIDFIDPVTGQVVLTDEPGTVGGASLPTGDYRICKASDSGAWGVEIWQ